jgi:two-component system sensor histidine kinase/response regulator
MLAYPRITDTGTLLIVDDQKANIEFLDTALRKLGFEILAASGGPEAFQRLGIHQPDLILLDLSMPEMDGFEVCRKIKKNPRWAEIPIIFLSEADDKDLLVRALETGGVDYIAKPFHHLELLARVRTHLALKLTRDALKQAAEDRNVMLDVLTQDLKKHLDGICVSAGMLRDGVAAINDPKLRLMVDNISASSTEMHSFANEFLANALTHQGRSIKVEDVDLLPVVSRTLRQYDESAKRKQLNFTTTVPASHMLVQANPAALNQVLANLLSNAVKFSPPGKDISITIRSTRAHVECEVQDQGPGFQPEDHSRMFARYSRLSARPTGGEPSTGLGLSIVKKLVQAMRGQIDCLNSPGGGATFVFSLPHAMAGSGSSTLVGKKRY